MDMDGIGTFALFLSSGAIGISLVLLRAYHLKLKARIEEARIDAISSDTIDELRHEMHRLSERVDFTERLLARGKQTEPAASKKSNPTYNSGLGCTTKEGTDVSQRKHADHPHLHRHA